MSQKELTTQGKLDNTKAILILSNTLLSLRQLEQFASVFSGGLSLTRTSLVYHRIDTPDGHPVRRFPYRTSSAERKVIFQHVTDMLEKGIMEPSASPWASLVLMEKKDGSWRFCADYRRLNMVTVKDVYPLPHIDDTLDCLQGSRYFSSIDLRSGYWQIPVHPIDWPKTAFITPDGLYHFNVMPFGLCNALATFESMMDSLLRGLKWSSCLRYLDDVVLLQHLRITSKVRDKC